MISNKKLAIDFDGTIVEDSYPSIGKPKTFAFETLKKLQSEGYRLILWTYRSGKTLDDAVEFCKKNGVEFYAVNSSFEGEVFDHETQSAAKPMQHQRRAFPFRIALYPLVV
jgi:hydroxymethylpyrimidine pyrophosphatase-like HAD family hydrolase